VKHKGGRDVDGQTNAADGEHVASVGQERQAAGENSTELLDNHGAADQDQGKD
jgi:hypothetical protein